MQAQNQTSNALVELVDIYPSLCEIAGLPIPNYLQGKSFYPLTQNPSLPWKKAVYSQFLMGHFIKKDIGLNDKMGYAIRTQNFRYVEWYTWKNGKRENLIAQELYDEINDPDENNNIAGMNKYKKLITQLSQQLLLK